MAPAPLVVTAATSKEAHVSGIMAVEIPQAQVVRDSSGRVVLICWGDDAPDVGVEWAARGYEVARIDRDTVGL